MAATDVSGFGTKVNLRASITFPVGFLVTQFADDTDPLDFPSAHIGDLSLGVNGDGIKWGRAVPLPMTLSVIPGSADDANLTALADANRVAQSKNSAGDTITATVVYPDGRTVVLTGGVMTDAPFGTGVSSQGRQKTRVFTFMFSNKV